MENIVCVRANVLRPILSVKLPMAVYVVKVLAGKIAI